MQAADLLFFPTDNRRALVRETAQRLAALNGDAANSYWRGAARELYGDLLARGQNEASARAEIGRFFDSVQVELCDIEMPSRSLVSA